MQGQFADRTIVVTGASGGIGMATARELARRGGRVVLVARRADQLEDLAAKISQEGGNALAMPCDVVNADEIQAMVDRIRDQLGPIHLLVNAAGRELMAPLQLVKQQTVRELFDVNVIAVAEMTRNCLGLLKAGSSIVNISSAAGIVGSAGLSVYGATKAALISLTQSLAKELAGRKVRVNAVAPGIVKTEMSQRMFNKMKPEQVAALEAAHPLGFGTPEDVARAVAFLGSSEAAWITGHTLVIDGGFSA